MELKLCIVYIYLDYIHNYVYIYAYFYVNASRYAFIWYAKLYLCVYMRVFMRKYACVENKQKYFELNQRATYSA